jgi:hypothetical protein
VEFQAQIKQRLAWVLTYYRKINMAYSLYQLAK